MREIHSLTEMEIIELLEICNINLSELATRDDMDNEGLDYVEGSQCFIKIYDPITDQPTSINVSFWEEWSNEGGQEAEIYSYCVELGFVDTNMGHSINPIQTIEWFLGNDFEIGNLQLKKA